MTRRAAVFLDRDGTINVEKNYLHKYEEWEWIPGSVEAIARLNAAGFLVIVVTNQAGVARGFYSEADIGVLHRHVDRELERLGARIDAYYHCPHHPDFGGAGPCECRKPKPGLVLQALRDWNIDPAASFMVGDKASDIRAARAAGVTPLLVQTGYGAAERHSVQAEAECVADLAAASLLITRDRGNAMTPARCA